MCARGGGEMIEIAWTVLLCALSIWTLVLAYIGIREYEASKCQSDYLKAQQNEGDARGGEQQNSAEGK